MIQFNGDAPWSYVLSDNTTGNAATTPVILTVAPLLPTTYTLKSVSNTCGVGTVSGSVTANVIITSIEQLLEDKLSLFPNPITERMNVKISLPAASEWQLIDLQGQLWYSRRWVGVSYEEIINTTPLPSGAYIFRVKVGAKWLGKKLIKQ